MKKSRLRFFDGSGGLNNRDDPSSIPGNEFQALENAITDEGGLYKGRKGMDSIQYAPIDPKPYVSDANTLALYDMTALSGNGGLLDSGPSVPARNMDFNTGNGYNPTPCVGLFPIANPGASQYVAGANYGSTGRIGNFSGWNSPGIASPLDGLTAVSFDGFFKIDPSFSGKPTIQSVYGSLGAPPVITAYSNNGAPLVGSFDLIPGSPYFPSTFLNGLILCRDYDFVSHKEISGPYLIFQIKTKGIIGTVTTIKSPELHSDTRLHFLATYDSVTGLMNLWINGVLVGTATPAGGGVVDDTTTVMPNAAWFIGGRAAKNINPDTGVWDGTYIANVLSTAASEIDEVRISNIARPAGAGEFPMKLPRGMVFELAKSDGTKQAVVSAEDGLYYTIGNGEWVKIGGGYDTQAYWDMVQMGDVLYMGNGVDNPLSWDGTTLRPWGEGTAPLTLQAQTGSGMLPGTYWYYYTFLYGLYETGPSIFTPITLSGAGLTNQVIISDIPLGPANCSGRRIYRTTVGPSGQSVPYMIRGIDDNVTTQISGPFVVGTPAGPTTDKGSDGVADSALGGGSNYVQMDAKVFTTKIKKNKYFAANYDRLFACGDPNRPFDLFMCETGAYEVWPAYLYTPAKAEGGPLTSVAVYETEIHCSKGGNGTLVLRGTQPSNWQQFEWLHPSIGSIDHWGNVHRQIPYKDDYMLCFPARDGIYGYQGGDFFKLSDKIKGTYDNLALNFSTRDQWTESQLSQFMAAAQTPGNGTTQNISCPQYGKDGLQEEPGKVQIVNQLDYLPLLNASSPQFPGKITAICKGTLPDEFFFATDAANQVYRTTDNFKSCATLGLPVGNAARQIDVDIYSNPVYAPDAIIEIAYVSGTVAGGDLVLVLFTRYATGTNVTYSPLANLDAGDVYTFNMQNGTAPVLVTTSPVYWQADIPVTALSVDAGSYLDSIGNPGAFQSDLSNLYLNHAQQIHADYDDVGIGNNLEMYAGSTTRTGVNRTDVGTITANNYAPVAGPGYCAFVRETETTIGPGRPGRPGHTFSWFSVYSTHRERCLYAGGTFRPQAVVLGGNVYFLASTAEQSTGNRISLLAVITGITSTNPGAYASHPFITWQAATALWTDGTNLLVNVAIPSATASWQEGVPVGFTNVIAAFNQALGALPSSSAYCPNQQILRGAYSANGFVANTVGLAAILRSLHPFTDMEFLNHTGELNLITWTSGAPTVQNALAYPLNTAWPMELVQQTTAPYAMYAVNAGMTIGDTVAVQAIDINGSVTGYKGAPFASNSSGPGCAVIFVPASSVAGNHLWADRLYWADMEGSITSLLQLGVPGNWTVLGTFESEAHACSSISSFDNLSSDYTGDVVFSLRNAADQGSLAAATYVDVKANKQITAFNPAQVYAQFKATFTWNGNENASPVFSFVEIGFFVGQSVVPRIIGAHYNNRTYWSVATRGSKINDTMLVFQKNNTWTTYKGWNILGMGTFRNQFVGWHNFNLVRLESGYTDLGAQIWTRLRTGMLLQDNTNKAMRAAYGVDNLLGNTTDKALRESYMDAYSFVNADFPRVGGWLQIRPYKGHLALPNTECFYIRATDKPESYEDICVWTNGPFGASWARNLALEIGTSLDLVNHAPSIGQVEQVAGMLCDFWVSSARMRNPTLVAD